MRVVTLKGPITKPIETQINIVTMFVSRIFLKLLNLLMINSIKMSLLASVLNSVFIGLGCFIL